MILTISTSLKFASYLVYITLIPALKMCLLLMSMSEAKSNRGRGGSIEMRKVLFHALKSLSFIP